MSDVIPAPQQPRIPVRSQQLPSDSTFPVRRIYCVGRNFAEHAREMGAAVPTSAADRGSPVFFCKPADAIVLDGVVPYPRGTRDLHHEVELVVAIGRDAPAGVLDVADAGALVFGYAVGLDLTRRDLQGAAKAKGLPWDTGKAFDHSAPISPIVPLAEAGELGARTLGLKVNGEIRQHGSLADLVWNVPEILHELSRLFALRAGDLVFMGTPAGVGPLQPGDRFEAVLDGIAVLQGQVTAPTV
ncbi:2-keto-4-pentenoate hydratase/2-oxohepta-3-ene-1,7-dioic acid hydratase in catechol pathway [Lysobacter niastensis]|jgi:fumarylpyruvate hydrolase|uniref:2-keto-4-pentenoate hydratase/2-oxohepta-3-ene-1,7-dioic acid hydratase in catechol pathway n=1 Tax=Lysobacter niastensis TaxID=380629 RepID=A0ABU1W7T8_9GAMM|nr:fumarylacetoacetate hydrolase family protein [Lysobacter niastensis]MDR7133661.1 2-keto-4-pentenoate hydratase/2-oxohepta-3-ene-1,7-dioic acid hydratase in catechol pathway [Lysobacter niastensis]